jgi:hypothetical protein
MVKWTSEKLTLKEGHGWVAKPGHIICVLDRGAVRFDVPKDWVGVPASTSFQLYNRAQPDDDCRLEASVMYLHPDVDWRGFSLTEALRDTIVDTFPTALRRGDVVRIERPDLELVWAEVSLLDPDERREARTRVCLARRGTIQALITMDFWPEDAERFGPVWDEALRSLQLGVRVKDPTHRKLN